MWHPWRHAGEHYPHVLIHIDQELPGLIWGLTNGQRIWLCRKLNQVRRRCTLTHELVHLERGPVPADPVGRAREELAVSVEAARRLITLAALAEALRWTREPAELADHLWVDQPTLRARMENLDPLEVAELEHHLEDQWLWIP